VSEQPVVWFGKKPKADAPPLTPAEDETFQAALKLACEQADFSVQQILVAQGNYGSWLIRLQREQQIYRLIWDGRLNQFRLEQETQENVWGELALAEPTDKEPATLLDTAATVLAGCSEAD
jgi:hypothetical protein